MPSSRNLKRLINLLCGIPAALLAPAAALAQAVPGTDPTWPSFGATPRQFDIDPAASPNDANGARPGPRDVAPSRVMPTTERPALAPTAKAAKPAALFGGGVSGYWDERAKTLIAQDNRGAGAPKVEGFPNHNIVVCLSGCLTEGVGVVFAEPKHSVVVGTQGEMVPSSGPIEVGETAEQPASINCIGGCYGSEPKLHPSPSRAEIRRRLQQAAEARLGVPATDGVPAKGAPASLQPSRPAIGPDDWFGRIKGNGSPGAD